MDIDKPCGQCLQTLRIQLYPPNDPNGLTREEPQLQKTSPNLRDDRPRCPRFGMALQPLKRRPPAFPLFHEGCCAVAHSAQDLNSDAVGEAVLVNDMA